MRTTSSRKSQLGYTVVELMMAMAIFSVGITGLFAMQSVTASANRFAKNMSVATALARSWQERLAMDGTSWGGKNAWPLSGTQWLSGTGTDPAWVLPANDDADVTVASFGPAAGARGQFVNYLVPDDVTEQLVFCTHIRLTHLIRTEEHPGSALIRSEVRVFWPKDIEAWDGGSDYCVADPADIKSIGKATENFHFVYQTTVIRQTSAF